jgi:ribosomal protein S18 acetylase RimI-like enzyme
MDCLMTRSGIRNVRESDLAAVSELIRRTIDACYPGVYPPRAVAFFKQYHSVGAIRERNRKGDVFVAERDGKVVATGSLASGEITGVFVDPEYQRMGIGAEVMRHLERRAAAEGCTEVELSVSLPSRGFYERQGYNITYERSIDVRDGERLEYWKAGKRLADPAGGTGRKIR